MNARVDSSEALLNETQRTDRQKVRDILKAELLCLKKKDFRGKLVETILVYSSVVHRPPEEVAREVSQTITRQVEGNEDSIGVILVQARDIIAEETEKRKSKKKPKGRRLSRRVARWERYLQSATEVIEVPTRYSPD